MIEKVVASVSVPLPYGGHVTYDTNAAVAKHY
jgi:hypothetical protein